LYPLRDYVDVIYTNEILHPSILFVVFVITVFVNYIRYDLLYSRKPVIYGRSFYCAMYPSLPVNVVVII